VTRCERWLDCEKYKYGHNSRHYEAYNALVQAQTHGFAPAKARGASSVACNQMLGLGLMADHFDIVSVGVKNERRVVLTTVLRTQRDTGLTNSSVTDWKRLIAEVLRRAFVHCAERVPVR
jgi:hypothetical protein